MKAIKYFLYTVLAASLFAGCSDDETYTPGEGETEGCYGVYFPSQDNAAELELDPADPTTLTFTAMRTNDADAITVPVVVTASEEGIFTVSDITFDEGQTETEFTVSFPNAEVGISYTCDISVTDTKYTSLYGASASGVAFTVTRVKWNLVTGPEGETKGKWREDVLTTFWGIANLEGEIEIYERDDRRGYYRIENVYSAEYLAELFEDTPEEMANYREDAFTIIDATDPAKVWIPWQNTGVDLGYGMISFGSDVSDNVSNSSNAYGMLENGIITFPTKGVLMSMADYNGGGLYYSNLSGLLRIMLPGAKDYDYSLAINAGESADGQLPIAVTLGADVARVAYAFFEGALGDAVAGANSVSMDAGEIETKEITASGTLTAQFDATGVYTIVANSYNAAGELQGYTSVSFGYVAAGDERPVVMTVGLDITDANKPQGYTSEDSAVFWAYGEDIASGKYAIYELDKLAGATADDLIAAVNTNGKAFTADDLAALNGNGLSLILGDLLGGTDYLIAVVANNGYVSDLFTATATTNGTPHPLKRAYTTNDIDGIEKADLFKTWTLYGVDFFDKENTKRQPLGEVTFAESDRDGEDVDLIEVSGLSLGACEDDAILWAYHNGFVFQYDSEQPLGSFDYNGTTLYVGQLIMDMNTTDGYSGSYMMVGGVVEEGYMAFVSTEEDFDLSGLWLPVFTDPEMTSQLSNWAIVSDLMLQDPAVAEAPAEKSGVSIGQLRALSNELSVAPANFVELRGHDRARALIDELCESPRIVNRIASTAPAAMPAMRPTAAKTTFAAGIRSGKVDFRTPDKRAQRVTE